MEVRVACKKQYPLEPLLTQREDAVDEQTRVLHERTDAAAQAERTRQRVVQEREEHDERTALQTRGESDRFDAGHASARDFARLGAWRSVQAHIGASLEQRESMAAGQERCAKQRVVEAQAELARARVAAKVVEQHRERFLAEVRREEERIVETEVDELVDSKHVCVGVARVWRNA